MTQKRITFIQDSIPDLKAGEYTVTLSQTVTPGTEGEKTIPPAVRQFAVQGERFSLNPNDVHAIFPINNSSGNYLNCLPHIIFNRAMLPWLRTLDSSGAQDLPWLALLLFNDGETPSIQAKTAVDLVPQGRHITVSGSTTLTGTGALPHGYYSYPFNNPGSEGAYTLDYGERPDEPIRIIDIPKSVFNKIVPSEADMEYLAHVREVDVTGKATGTGRGGKGATVDTGTYSLVIGNRLPKQYSKSVVHLVSLENMGSHLPGGNGEDHLPSGTTHVRLVSLKHWNFTAMRDDHALQVALENLNRHISNAPVITTLRLPGETSSGGQTGDVPSQSEVTSALAAQSSGTLTDNQARVLVNNALSMGYTAMNHQTRAGSETVSWYHGPLTPFQLSQTLPLPAPYADILTAYNPKTGLLDVSYSTAWELGQLMALKDKEFSTTLYNWKNQYRREHSGVRFHERANEELEERANSKDKSHLGVLARLFRHRLTEPRQGETDVNLDRILKWLLKLRKLHGVPFNYWVPDENMLPVESLRFFYLDRDWIDALTYGALNIGHSMDNADPEHAIMTALQSSPEYINSTVTGFLLRSQTVVGWPGLITQIIAGTPDPGGNLDHQAEMHRLRWEKLSDNLMLAMVSGEIGTVVFHEPEEALHFGVEQIGGRPYVRLRGLRHNPGHELNVLLNVRIFPRTGDRQTLKISQTADRIEQRLRQQNQQANQFTSAEFAVEMVKGAAKVVFQRN